MDQLSATATLREDRLRTEEQAIPASDVWLQATLSVPPGARGVVVMAHASSAGRFNRPNRFAAEVLEQGGLGTLQVDLLTPEAEDGFCAENQSREQTLRLATRIVSVIDWLAARPELRRLALGVRVSNREAIAALIAARRDARIAALVSLGVFPSGAAAALADISVPALIIGSQELGRDEELVLEFFEHHFRAPMH